MVKSENKKINNIEKLVETIAVTVLKLTGKVDNVEKDISELKKDTKELKEGNKDIRRDIFNLGDRFVPYHMFDKLASRVNILEKKVK